jgi:hypothetical protein
MNNTLRPIVDGGCSSNPKCAASTDLFWARFDQAEFQDKLDKTGDRDNDALSDALYHYERVLGHKRICVACRQEAEGAIAHLQLCL